MVASLKSWFHYATTDGELVGVLAWISLAITIAGFWIAISQIRKVKRASQAANDAVIRLAQAARSQESGVKVSSALQHLTSAQSMIRKDNADAASAHLFAGWNALISAREMLDDASDREQVSGYVVSTWRLLDDINMPGATFPPAAQMLQERHLELSKTLSGLGTLSARLSALLSGIGKTP